MKKLSILLVVWVLVMVAVGSARAQASANAQESSYPEQVNAQNPYGQGLASAKQSYEEAYRRYVEAYQRASWSWAYYQAYYRAYYDLWTAYSRYVWYLRMYWWTERSRAFSGRVVADEAIDYYPRPPAPPVAGATVQLMTYVPPGSRRAVQLLGTRTTDPDGRFRFDGVAEGTYTYTVQKTGFVTARNDIQLRSGMPVQEVRLRRERGVSGVILARPLYGIVPADPPPGYLDPRPLEGVRVTLYRTDVVYIRAPGPDRTAVTGPDGRFQFDDVAFASARVVVEKTSYQTASQNVALTGGSASVRIVMEYNGPPPPRPADASFDDVNRR